MACQLCGITTRGLPGPLKCFKFSLELSWCVVSDNKYSSNNVNCLKCDCYRQVALQCRGSVLYGSRDVVFVKLTVNVLTAMMWYVYKVLYRLLATFILFYRAIPKHWTFLYVYFKVHLHCVKANAKSVSFPGGFLQSSICCSHRAAKKHKKNCWCEWAVLPQLDGQMLSVLYCTVP